MVPVVLASQLFQVFFEKSTHRDDAVGHALHFAQPLLVQCWVIEDLRCDTGAVDGRVRVERSDEDLDLGVHTFLLFGRGADN